VPDVQIHRRRGAGPVTVLRQNAEMLVSPEMLRTIFDLPPEYVFLPTERFSYAVHLPLHIASLPDVEPGQTVYLVQPIYQRLETGSVKIKEVRITPASER
jgi:hypothetical protein